MLKLTIGAALAGAGLVGGWLWLTRVGVAPATPGEAMYVRFENRLPMREALKELEAKGIVRNARAMHLYARLTKRPGLVRDGTFELVPGWDANQVFEALEKPMRQMVRLPETNWAARNAKILEREGVASAEEYLALIGQPEAFEGTVDFPLPEGSLEGYLYPDTYDLPPMLGARQTILRQLRAFERKVWEPMGKPDAETLRRAVVVGSMIELEVARNEERPVVAGVIENRLKAGMPLQIDATLNYAIQEWRPLTYEDYRTIDSPYSTYRNKELPPGPICSPTVRSIQAAMNPEMHPYLYYVAMPEGKHLFATTYDQHLQNVRLRREAMRRKAS